VVFTSIEEASSDPFPLLGALHLQSLLKCHSFPYFQHTTFIGFPKDLDLPLDLHLPLDGLFLFLFSDRPHTDKASPFWLSIFFLVITSISKDETISSKC